MRIEETVVVTVRLFGEWVSGKACEQLGETFERLVDAGHDRIILDLAEVPYIDSAGIDELIRFCVTIDQTHVALELQNPSKGVQAVISSELYGHCDCFGSDQRRQDVSFHAAEQDTECDAWERLVDVIEQAARDRREELSPLEELDPTEWRKIITLPPSIAKLTAVKTLSLYGSHLVRIPREIGEMTNLESFDPYTSRKLHWFPYEITRCKKLALSRVSTRDLYGNYKNRPGFPQLPANFEETSALVDMNIRPDSFVQCSLCDARCDPPFRYQYWISLNVATDVLPLLVNACSQECADSLPTPPGPCARETISGQYEYLDRPHQGGPHLQQPTGNRSTATSQKDTRPT